MGASAIYKKLEDTDQENAPSLRAVQKRVREDRSIDRSGPWRLSMSSPEDARFVFACISAAISATKGRIRWVTAVEAEWIIRINRLGGATLKPFGA